MPPQVYFHWPRGPEYFSFYNILSLSQVMCYHTPPTNHAYTLYNIKIQKCEPTRIYTHEYTEMPYLLEKNVARLQSRRTCMLSTSVGCSIANVVGRVKHAVHTLDIVIFWSTIDP